MQLVNYRKKVKNDKKKVKNNKRRVKSRPHCQKFLDMKQSTSY